MKKWRGDWLEKWRTEGWVEINIKRWNWFTNLTKEAENWFQKRGKAYWKHQWVIFREEVTIIIIIIKRITTTGFKLTGLFVSLLRVFRTLYQTQKWLLQRSYFIYYLYLWLAQLLWTMYFTYTLLSQTVDANIKFICHLFTLYYCSIHLILVIQLLLLHEINHYLFIYLFIYN